MLLRFLFVLHSLTSASGAFRGVVVDGHSIGRPCCKVHNCTHPLINNRKHFCHMHHATESKKCVITDCSAPVEDGFRTCSNPVHREMENHRNARGQAFFQLQQRLKRFSIGQVVNSFTDHTEIGDNDDDDDESEDTPKSDEGNRKPKARFGRRRTHNEQLVVCCCGVIAARATIFGAEAISGVKVSHCVLT
jgi:hypothetical protein